MNRGNDQIADYCLRQRLTMPARPRDAASGTAEPGSETRLGGCVMRAHDGVVDACASWLMNTSISMSGVGPNPITSKVYSMPSITKVSLAPTCSKVILSEQGVSEG